MAKILANRQLFEERQKQVELCSHLDRYKRGAKTILELKDKFRVTGDFTMMERLVASVSYAINEFNF